MPIKLEKLPELQNNFEMNGARASKTIIVANVSCYTLVRARVLCINLVIVIRNERIFLKKKFA